MGRSEGNTQTSLCFKTHRCVAGAELCFRFKKYAQIFVCSTTQDRTKKKKKNQLEDECLV